MMEDHGCDSVVSYVDASPWHPKYMATPGGHHRVFVFKPSTELPVVYLRSGDIYLTKTDVLLSLDLYGKDSRALIIPRERYCNINEPVDLKIAEALL
jgi:CMP-N-acetylneuraminic acid synthetase